MFALKRCKVKFFEKCLQIILFRKLRAEMRIRSNLRILRKVMQMFF